MLPIPLGTAKRSMTRLPMQCSSAKLFRWEPPSTAYTPRRQNAKHALLPMPVPPDLPPKCRTSNAKHCRHARQCKPPMQSSAANALAAKRRQCPCAQVSKRSAQSSNAPDFAAPQLQYQTSHHDTNYRSIILPVTSSMGCAAAYHWRDIWPSLLANGVTWRQCNRCGTFYRSSDFRLTIRSMEYKTPGHLAA